jgi:hypothetical protein
MTRDTLQQTYNSYLGAYSDIGATERKRQLQQSVADDVISINPDGESRGFENLVEHIEQFQKQKRERPSTATSLLLTTTSSSRSGRCTATMVQRSLTPTDPSMSKD